VTGGSLLFQDRRILDLKNAIIEKNILIKTVDIICLGSIGIMCFLYSIFWSTFAETHITLPFLNFPIFIGEILLLECSLLLVLKWRITKVKFNYKHYLLFLYVAWVLVKALNGYFEWGPLALRNAALFYYPFFAVIGYYFYRNDYFNKKTIMALFIVFLVTKITRGSDMRFYFYTPYIMLSTVLILKMNQRWLKYIALGVLLYVFPYKNFLQGSRSFIIANFATLFFLGSVYTLGVLKFKRRIKILSVILFFLISILVFLNFVPSKKVRSMTTPQYLIEEIIRVDQLIERNKKNYIPRVIPVKVYNPNDYQDESPYALELERIVKETRVKVLAIAVEIEREAKSRIDSGSKVSSITQLYNQSLKKAQQLPEQRIVEVTAPEVKRSAQQLPEQIVEKLTVDDFSSIPPPFKKRLENLEGMEDMESVYLNIFQTEKENIMKEIFSDKRMGEINDWKIELFNQGFGIAVNKSIEGLIWKKKVIFERTAQSEYGNILFRLFLWRDMAVELIKDKAWLGFSFGKPQRSISLELFGSAGGEWGRDGWIAPHNAFFHMIYRSGIFGLVATLAIFFTLFSMVKKFVKRKSLKGLLLSSILVYWLVLSSFLVVLELPYQAIPFWTLFGMVIAYLKGGSGRFNLYSTLQSDERSEEKSHENPRHYVLHNETLEQNGSLKAHLNKDEKKLVLVNNAFIRKG